MIEKIKLCNRGSCDDVCAVMTKTDKKNLLCVLCSHSWLHPTVVEDLWHHVWQVFGYLSILSLLQTVVLDDIWSVANVYSLGFCFLHKKTAVYRLFSYAMKLRCVVPMKKRVVPSGDGAPAPALQWAVGLRWSGTARRSGAGPFTRPGCGCAGGGRGAARPHTDPARFRLSVPRAQPPSLPSLELLRMLLWSVSSDSLLP